VKQFERSSMAMTELRSNSGNDLPTAARIDASSAAQGGGNEAGQGDFENAHQAFTPLSG
jgi:hypothetical protein